MVAILLDLTRPSFVQTNLSRHLEKQESFPVSDFRAIDEAGRPVLSVSARNRLKLAAKELRELTGLTLVEIGERTGVSKSQWHHYEALDAPDLIPVHVYLPLELHLGQAPVTRALAAMNGLSVMTETQAEERARIADLMVQAARETGEALTALAEASADGHISPNEAKRVDAEYADVERIASKVRTFVASILPRRG